MGDAIYKIVHIYRKVDDEVIERLYLWAITGGDILDMCDYASLNEAEKTKKDKSRKKEKGVVR